MRECYRLQIKENAVPTTYMSLIFVASTKLLDKNFHDINKSIIKLIAKL